MYYPAGDRTPDLLNQRQTCYQLSQRGESVLYFVKQPSRATQNSPESSGLKTPALDYSGGQVGIWELWQLNCTSSKLHILPFGFTPLIICIINCCSHNARGCSVHFRCFNISTAYCTIRRPLQAVCTVLLHDLQVLLYATQQSGQATTLTLTPVFNILYRFYFLSSSGIY